MSRDYSNVLSSLEVIKSDLVQVVGYESFKPHCAIILELEPPHLLESLENLRNFCIKQRLDFPLVVTRKFVEKSLDSFPLEFLDIASGSYHNIFCNEDLLAKLKFAKTEVRLQMERELKSKWLLTRLTVLEARPKPKILSQTLRASIHAIAPALKGLCFCADIPIPASFPELLAKVSQITACDLKPMEKWEQLEKAELTHIKNYLEILQNLINYMEASE